jgi:hypothetical protein
MDARRRASVTHVVDLLDTFRLTRSFNGAYLAGRAGHSLIVARQLTQNMHPNYERANVRVFIAWSHGRIVQKWFDFLVWMEPVVAVFRAATHIRSTRVNVIHLDPLMRDASLDSRAFTATSDYLLDRMDSAIAHNRQDVLVVRYDGATENPEQVKMRLLENLFQLGGLRGRAVKMKRYLQDHAIIVARPMGLIHPSDVVKEVQQTSMWRGGTNVWLNIYTTAPEQFDMNESLVNFIVFAIAGNQVVPISTQLQGARVVAVGA